MKKIRVIHCVGQLGMGGAETLIVNAFKYIDRDHFQFDFLVFNEQQGFYDDEVRKLGGNIYYLSSLSKVGVYQYIKQLKKFFRQEQPDVVHSHMDWLGGFISYAAKQSGVKNVIVHSHANQKLFDSNIISKLLITFNKYLIYRNANQCLACSKIAGTSLFMKEFQVLFNGIDTQKYIHPNLKKIQELREELRIKDDDIILGTVGSMTINKNHIFLLDIMAELKKTSNTYKLVLVGNGAEYANLKQKVKELDLMDDVVFTGIRSEIPELMNIFDIFLLPSITEGLGIVLVEAQVSGLACIVSNGVPKDVVIDEKLVQFLPFDNMKWIENIKQSLCIKHHQNNDYMKYDIQTTCKVLEKIYSSK